MNEPNSIRIARSITRFRWLAIGLAAIVAIVASTMILRITMVLDHGAGSKINLSGKQRLLSQRIKTDAIEIRDAVDAEHWDELPPLLDDLRASTDAFIDAHRTLFAGRSLADYFLTDSVRHLDLVGSLQIPLKQIADSSAELQKLTANTIRRAPYIDDRTPIRIAAAEDEISGAQTLFLPRMDEIVGILERESRSKIDRSIGHAKLGMVVLLLVLAAIILFIIEPSILIIRRQLRELDIATRHAKRADTVRWRLLTNMGHEFRTPMNAIMGFAGLLDEKSLSETERARLTQAISESSTQLTHLIESMLDMSAIESGQLSIIDDRCDPARLLEKLRADIASAARSKNLRLDFRVDPSCPRIIKTDPRRLEQILYNLLENAIKFTQAGGVSVGVRLIDDGDRPRLEFTVADTGIGIQPQQQSAIFDAFKQTEDSLTRDFGGAGLGLAISQEIAHALGGHVTVRSAPGKGSVFTLTIAPSLICDPGDGATAPHPAGEEASFESRRILIVDDAKDNRLLLDHVLRKTGAQISFAHDGQQAIDTVTDAGDRGAPFDLILMDMQMPILDGYHATVTIRGLGITTPIIAVTAHALEGDREQCLGAGCNDYLSKPVDKAKLVRACARLIFGQEPGAPIIDNAAA